MGLHDDGFKTGRQGGSVFGTNDTLGWAAGDAVRRMEGTLEGGSGGEEDPNAWPIFILAGAVAAGTAVLLEMGLVPSFLTVAGWRVGVAWLVATAALYFGLKALPSWLSGTLMGVSLGGVAGFAALVYLGPLWAVCLGLGVGALMYLIFSTLQ